MSNIKIDNPQRLLALSDQMYCFQSSFEKFIENIRNTVQTTMDQLTRLQHVMQDKISVLENELSQLYNELSGCDESENSFYAAQKKVEISICERRIRKYRKHIDKIENAYKSIDYQYQKQVKHYEDELVHCLSKFPASSENLDCMFQIMKEYITFSSELVGTNLTGDFGTYNPCENNSGTVLNAQNHHFQNVSPRLDIESFYSYIENKNSNDSGKLDSIQFGRMKGYEKLSDLELSNAELLAQQKNSHSVIFEIGDSDIELCEKSGYNIHRDNNGKLQASKNLYNTVDLSGGLFKGGFIFKKDEHYKLD